MLGLSECTCGDLELRSPSMHLSCKRRTLTDRNLSQADKIETLEKEQGWREEEFDFILQFMRTILMKRKHKASCASFILVAVDNNRLQMVPL